MSNTDSFIEEVTEEVRRDRLYALMRRYGWIAVLAILLLVGGAAWNEWRKAQAQARAAAFGDAILAALAASDTDGRAAGGGAADGAGFFVKPTVLVNTNPTMSVVREEIFGPVVVAMPFDDIDEVARLANDTIFGLGASIWSNNLRKVHRLVPKIKAGTVWINCHNVLDPALPFGGYKQSGLGREMGKAVFDMYTESKSVMMAL